LEERCLPWSRLSRSERSCGGDRQVTIGVTGGGSAEPTVHRVEDVAVFLAELGGLQGSGHGAGRFDAVAEPTTEMRSELPSPSVEIEPPRNYLHVGLGVMLNGPLS